MTVDMESFTLSERTSARTAIVAELPFGASSVADAADNDDVEPLDLVRSTESGREKRIGRADPEERGERERTSLFGESTGEEVADRDTG